MFSFKVERKFPDMSWCAGKASTTTFLRDTIFGQSVKIGLICPYLGFRVNIMTISDRIFEKLRQTGLTQKTFSEKTGISPSTISEWKSKKTNPTFEKIMVICKVVDVTPEWLLSGIENTGERGNNLPWYVIDKDTEMGQMITGYHEMNE